MKKEGLKMERIKAVLYCIGFMLFAGAAGSMDAQPEQSVWEWLCVVGAAVAVLGIGWLLPKRKQELVAEIIPVSREVRESAVARCRRINHYTRRVRVKAGSL